MADHESAVICDLAQYYNIYDWRKFEIGYIATLTVGLPSDSRTVKEISEVAFSLDTMIQAIIADYLANILYVEIKKSTKKKVPAPKSLLAILQRNRTDENAKNEMQTFRSVEEFERARQRIIEG